MHAGNAQWAVTRKRMTMTRLACTQCQAACMAYSAIALDDQTHETRPRGFEISQCPERKQEVDGRLGALKPQVKDPLLGQEWETVDCVLDTAGAASK